MQNRRRLCALFISAFALAVPGFAQSSATCNTATPAICSLYPPSTPQQIKPQAVPTSSTPVVTVDAYLQTVTVTNTSGSAVSFTLADRQGSPVAVMAAVSIAANTTYVIAFPSLYWCPSGFSVLASATGLSFYASWRQ